MTEEEKKAIEYLKDYIKSDLNYFTIDFNNNLRISMNLIEKLKKENEMRKKDYIVLHKMYNNKCVEIMELEENSLTIKQVQENFIPKDKIREKLEGLKLIDEYEAPNGWESERMYSEEILKELLEEE